MKQKSNLYQKTKQVLEATKIHQLYSARNKEKYYNEEDMNQNYQNKSNNHSYDNKYYLQKNNEKIIKLNKSIQENKNIISNILSPMKADIQKEERDFQINSTLNELKNIKSIYNLNTIQLKNDFDKIKTKKNKLLLVYNSLYNFKQKLLIKEKEIIEREKNINKFETNLKTNENILKDNLEAFNKYINFQTQNLVNKFKNIKNYHDQKEEELKLKEKKIHEYELIIRNIIRKKESENREKLEKCEEIGVQIEKNLELEMQKIQQKEKEEQIIKDKELIEKEKEQIEKEKELIHKEKEKIEMEKELNKKNKKKNKNFAKKLKKREIDFQESKIINYDMNNFNSNLNINTQYQTPIRDISNLFNKFYYNNKIKEKKSLTPTVFHSKRNNISNPYLRNKNLYNKDDSLLSSENISNKNYTSKPLRNEQIGTINKNNTYIHDNIYLLKNHSNNKSNNFFINKKISNYKSESKRCNSSRASQKIIDQKRNYNYYNNNFTNRTLNLVGNVSNNNNITDNTDVINMKMKNPTIEEKSIVKYLETNSNENNETYNDINKKIFEIEKALQLVKSQDKKIQIIKDKLDKKMKNTS